MSCKKFLASPFVTKISSCRMVEGCTRGCSGKMCQVKCVREDGVNICKHVGETLFFQILSKFGDSWGWLWGFLPIEMKSSAASEAGFESLLVR